VDSIFMMPQLGILSTVHPVAAAQVFERDCLIKLGDSVCAVGPGDQPGVAFRLVMDGQETVVQAGELKLLPLGAGEKRTVTIHPGKGWDVGAGKNKTAENISVEGGVGGLILDGRGRPIALPADENERAARQNDWLNALDLPQVSNIA